MMFAGRFARAVAGRRCREARERAEDPASEWRGRGRTGAECYRVCVGLWAVECFDFCALYGVVYHVLVLSARRPTRAGLYDVWDSAVDGVPSFRRLTMAEEVTT